MIIEQPVAIPADCRVDPVAPLAVDPPQLPSLPPEGAPDHATVRLQRAELVGLYALDVADEERTARETNAVSQAACAAWARSRP